jgi:hypothetical protein
MNKINKCSKANVWGLIRYMHPDFWLISGVNQAAPE